jgi:hypothetical protein
MDALSTNQGLTLFGKWEPENKSMVLLFSTPSAMSFKNEPIVPFQDNCLIPFGEDNTAHLCSGSLVLALGSRGHPRRITGAVSKFKECVRVSENPEMQRFLCASSSAASK